MTNICSFILVALVGLGTLISSASSSSSTTSSGSCPHLLFSYFLDRTQPWSLHYAVSQDGTHWTPLNNGYPTMNCTIQSLRDPFVNVGPDNKTFHLVATNGENFGGTPTILHWSSSDLITWSAEQVIDIMGPQFFPPPAAVNDLWAPEWRWDPVTNRYMVFFAARGTGIMPDLPSPNCTGTQSSRFAFFRSFTTDFLNFTTPEVFFDPGCFFTGDGGIDADLVQDENGRYLFVYKDARGVGEGVAVEAHRGIRLAYSDTIDGPYLNATITDFLVPTLVEAPEIYRVPDNSPLGGGFFLYFDCSFWPVPSGYPRPPFGVAHSPTLSQFSFTTLEGSCTGNNTANMQFPVGATHGSFICISDSQLSALEAAFPSSSSSS
jgi:hypothetical protein